MGVSENRQNPIVPNGFADHYPVLKNGYFIGNIPNIFRQTHMTANMSVLPVGGFTHIMYCHFFHQATRMIDDDWLR